MTATQTAASLALAQVNLILAETQQRSSANARHQDALVAIKKRLFEMGEELDRLASSAEAEGIDLEQRATQLESEVQKFIKLNEELAS